MVHGRKSIKVIDVKDQSVDDTQVSYKKKVMNNHSWTSRATSILGLQILSSKTSRDIEFISVSYLLLLLKCYLMFFNLPNILKSIALTFSVSK